MGEHSLRSTEATGEVPLFSPRATNSALDADATATYSTVSTDNPVDTGTPGEDMKAMAARHSATARVRYITHIDLRSAFKVGFVISLSLFVVWFITMALLWIILNVAGVWGQMNDLMSELMGLDAVSAGLYFALITGVGLVELFVFTFLAPVGALIYNSAVGIMGGLRVTVENGTRRS